MFQTTNQQISDFIRLVLSMTDDLRQLGSPRYVYAWSKEFGHQSVAPVTFSFFTHKRPIWCSIHFLLVLPKSPFWWDLHLSRVFETKPLACPQKHPINWYKLHKLLRKSQVVAISVPFLSHCSTPMFDPQNVNDHQDAASNNLKRTPTSPPSMPQPWLKLLWLNMNMWLKQCHKPPMTAFINHPWLGMVYTFMQPIKHWEW